MAEAYEIMSSVMEETHRDRDTLNFMSTFFRELDKGIVGTIINALIQRRIFRHTLRLLWRSFLTVKTSLYACFLFTYANVISMLNKQLLANYTKKILQIEDSDFGWP